MAPTVVGEGEDSRLAGGASGLFLFMSTYRAGEEVTDQFQVQKFDGTSFVAPVNVGAFEQGYQPDFHQSASGALFAPPQTIRRAPRFFAPGVGTVYS